MRINGEIQGLFEKYELQLRSGSVGQQHSQQQHSVVQNYIHDIL
jgi:hypothetical protein